VKLAKVGAEAVFGAPRALGQEVAVRRPSSLVKLRQALQFKKIIRACLKTKISKKKHKLRRGANVPIQLGSGGDGGGRGQFEFKSPFRDVGL
jgi:hypothetical protein